MNMLVSLEANTSIDMKIKVTTTTSLTTILVDLTMRFS